MRQPPAPPPRRPGRPLRSADDARGPQPGYRPPPGRPYGAPQAGSYGAAGGGYGSGGSYGPPPPSQPPGPGGPAGPAGPRRRRSGLSIGMRIAAGLLSLAILVSSGVAWSFYRNFVSDVQTITLARPVDQDGKPAKDIDG